jgi:hypothetical protein
MPCSNLIASRDPGAIGLHSSRQKLGVCLHQINSVFEFQDARVAQLHLEHAPLGRSMGLLQVELPRRLQKAVLSAALTFERFECQG